MFRIILFTFLIEFALISLPFIALVQAAENITVTLDVPGMTCEFCPVTIRKALEKVPGVIEVKTNYKRKTAKVIFDPGLTDIKSLTKATAYAGYPSTLKH